MPKDVVHTGSVTYSLQQIKDLYELLIIKFVNSFNYANDKQMMFFILHVVFRFRFFSLYIHVMFLDSRFFYLFIFYSGESFI